MGCFLRPHSRTSFNRRNARVCKSVSEFYRKANKFLKLDGSKESPRKAEGATIGKKNDQGEAPDNKSKDK